MKLKYSYLEYVALPVYQQIFYKFYRFLWFLIWAVYDLFKGLGLSVFNFFKKVVITIKKMAVALRYGDWATKLSFLFVGTSYIKRGQIVKGILMIALEIVFILYFALFAASTFSGFFTLGTIHRVSYICPVDDLSDVAGQIFSEFEDNLAAAQAAGCTFPELYQQPDNSGKLLLYGVITLVIIIAFIIFYTKSTIGAFRVECNREEGKHINSFKEDVGELLNGKFHITLLTLPIIGIVVFTIFPLIDMILIAFTNYDKTHAYEAGSTFSWVGFRNFGLLTQFGQGAYGNTFASLFRWTIVWAILATFTNFILGILIATLINKKGIKLKGLWRTCLVLSVALPQFVSLLAMSQFFGNDGLLHDLIFRLTGNSVTFWNHKYVARTLIVIINIWIGVPFTVLSTTGILMNIPADLYESARIDGANPVTMYTKITVPYIIFVLGPSLITTFIGNVNNFGVIYLLTGGGPKNAELDPTGIAGDTSILITWLYGLTTGDNKQYYLASVIGIVIFIISSVLSLLVYRNSSSYKNEEDFA